MVNIIKPEEIVKSRLIEGYVNPDFKWSEFIKPEDGIPTLEQAKNTKKILDILSIYKHKIWKSAPIIITCGGRSLQHHLRIYKEINNNRIKKGLQPLRIPMGSWHLKYLAVDFVVVGVNRQQVFKDMDEVHFGGLEYPDDQDRTHIDLRGQICRFRGDNIIAHHYNQVKHDKIFHN